MEEVKWKLSWISDKACKKNASLPSQTLTYIEYQVDIASDVMPTLQWLILALFFSDTFLLFVISAAEFEYLFLTQ